MNIDSPLASEIHYNEEINIGGWLFDNNRERNLVSVKYYAEGIFDDWLIGSSGFNESEGVNKKFSLPSSKKCRFASNIHPAFLYSKDVIKVTVVSEDMKEDKICEIEVKNEFNPQQTYSATLSPIKILTLGRTGSTYFINLLSEHPEIVVNKFFNESNISSHYLSYIDKLYPPMRQNYWNEGVANLKNIEAINSGQLVEFPFIDKGEWYFDKYPSSLTAFIKKNIDTYYSLLKNEVTKYFIEKGVVHDKSITMLDKMYKNAKFIFLVRDFRDMYASVIQFNKKRGIRAFGMEHFKKDEEYITRLGEYCNSTFLGAYKKIKDRSLLVRYEDLIKTPQDTVKNIYRYLDVNSSDSLVNAILKEQDSTTKNIRKKHMTSCKAEDSIKKYEKNLDNQTIHLINSCFRESLKFFGY